MTEKKFNPHDRKRARRYALQALYQWQFTQDDMLDIQRYFLNNYDMKKVEVEYLTELMREISENIAEIDNTFLPYLDRPLKDLNAIELSCLRIGVYELLKRLDVPYKVAINEAVELTKKFGTVEGYKYVNAILDKLAPILRPHG